GELIERMKHITGMFTPVGPPDDRRPELFSRYLHVRRVATVALGCCSRVTSAGGEVNQPRVRPLAWLHGLNRWPFAHNSEKGRYDQAADVRAYLQANRIELDHRDTADIVGVHHKSSGELSREGSVVLTADQATGAVEDIFLAITAVGLAPEA